MQKKAFHFLCITFSLVFSTLLAHEMPNTKETDSLAILAAGSAQQVRDLIASDPRIQSSARYMTEALNVAILFHNKDGVRTLLTLGANPNTPVIVGFGSCVIKAIDNFLGTVGEMINAETKAFIRHADNSITSEKIPLTDALHAQRLKSSKEILEIIISYPKTNLLQKDARGRTPYLVVHSDLENTNPDRESADFIDGLRHVKHVLECELIKRGINPEILLRDNDTI